jgi:hypothetical protein
MSRLKPKLDEWVKRHDDLCTCTWMFIGELKYCDCGQPRRASELAALRTTLETMKEEIFARDNELLKLHADLEEANKWIKGIKDFFGDSA